MMPETMVSLDEYLHSTYEPDAEYVDGVIEERNVGEWDHCDLQTEIAVWVRNHYRSNGINAIVETRIQVAPTRFRVPDVTIVTKRPAGAIISEPPLAVIEILSPEDRLARVQTRMRDFRNFGVRYIWLVDPASRTATAYTSEGTVDVKDGILRGENPDFEIPLPELFRTLDESFRA